MSSSLLKFTIIKPFNDHIKSSDFNEHMEFIRYEWEATQYQKGNSILQSSSFNSVSLELLALYFIYFSLTSYTATDLPIPACYMSTHSMPLYDDNNATMIITCTIVWRIEQEAEEKYENSKEAYLCVIRCSWLWKINICVHATESMYSLDKIRILL
jgi:hypothetical protein